MPPELKRRPEGPSKSVTLLLRGAAVLIAAVIVNLLGANGCARRSSSPPPRLSPPSRATANLAALERLHPLYPELRNLSKLSKALRDEHLALKPTFPSPAMLPGVAAPAAPELQAPEAGPSVRPLGEALSSEMARLEAARRRQMERALAQEEAELRAEARLKLDAKRRVEEEKAAALEELAVRAAKNEINRLTIQAAVPLNPDAAGKSEQLREEIQQRNADVKTQLAAAKEDLRRLTDEIAQARQQATRRYEREIQTALEAELSQLNKRRQQLDEEFAAMRREQENALKPLLGKPPAKIEFTSFPPKSQWLKLTAEGLQQAQKQAQSDADASAEDVAERMRASLAQIEAQRKALRRRIRTETETAAEAAARQMGNTLHGPPPAGTQVPDVTSALLQELQTGWSGFTEP